MRPPVMQVEICLSSNGDATDWERVPFVWPDDPEQVAMQIIVNAAKWAEVQKKAWPNLKPHLRITSADPEVVPYIQMALGQYSQLLSASDTWLFQSTSLDVTITPPGRRKSDR